MTKPSSAAELDRRVEAALAALREQNAKSGPPSKRWLDTATRARVSEGVIHWNAEKAAADPNTTPLRRARYARAWSLKKTAQHAEVALNSVWSAELHPERTNWKTKVSLSRALGVPVKALFPDHATP